MVVVGARVVVGKGKVVGETMVGETVVDETVVAGTALVAVDVVDVESDPEQAATATSATVAAMRRARTERCRVDLRNGRLLDAEDPAGIAAEDERLFVVAEILGVDDLLADRRAPAFVRAFLAGPMNL